jgi:hypothetical protein
VSETLAQALSQGVAGLQLARKVLNGNGADAKESNADRGDR